MSSKSRSVAIKKAFGFGIDLMPIDCLNILMGVYGARLERMKGATIFRLVYSMMLQCTDQVDEAYIKRVVLNWLND